MYTRTSVAEIADPTPRSIAIGPFGSSLKADMYKPSGIPVVRGQNIVDAPQIDEKDLVFVSQETADRFPACMLSEGDLVFPHRGAIGRVGIVGKRPMLLSSSMMKLRCDRSKVNPRFMLYYFRGPGKAQLLMRASTVGTPGIGQPLASLRSIPLDIPSLPEQHAIAEVLGALDDKIAANNKTIQLADSLTSALAEDAFSRGNFVPLASIAEITMGNSPKGETLNEDGEGLAFFQGIRDFGVRYPQERVSSTAPTRFAKELDTLFSVRAPVGTVNLAGMPCSIGRGISALSSKTETPYALFQAVRASKIWERYNAEGTVFGSINRKQLEQSEIPWVFHSERYELESTLAGLERLLRTATVMNETLSSVRDTLLPQLMSGKIRVRDAEAIVEDVL